jgi:hypothetical protein
MRVFRIYDPNRKSEIHASYGHYMPAVNGQYTYSFSFLFSFIF